MKFKLAALMLTTLLAGCGGSASSEVENNALPDMSYDLAIELLLTDTAVTGNTSLTYGGELQLRHKNVALALSGTDSLEIRDPLTRLSTAEISNNPASMRCCVLTDSSPDVVSEQLLQRPQLLFWRFGNVDDSFILQLPPSLLLQEGRLLFTSAFGFKKVGNGTLHFYWAADGYPTEVVVEQKEAVCPAGENAVRLVRNTSNNQIFIHQTELGRCTSDLLQLTFSRSKTQDYRTSIQTAAVKGLVTVKRVLNLVVDTNA